MGIGSYGGEVPGPSRTIHRGFRIENSAVDVSLGVGYDGVDNGAQVLITRLENLEFWHLKIEDGCLRSSVE